MSQSNRWHIKHQSLSTHSIFRRIGTGTGPVRKGRTERQKQYKLKFESRPRTDGAVRGEDESSRKEKNRSLKEIQKARSIHNWWSPNKTSGVQKSSSQCVVQDPELKVKLREHPVKCHTLPCAMHRGSGVSSEV